PRVPGPPEPKVLASGLRCRYTSRSWAASPVKLSSSPRPSSDRIPSASHCRLRSCHAPLWALSTENGGQTNLRARIDLCALTGRPNRSEVLTLVHLYAGRKIIVYRTHISRVALCHFIHDPPGRITFPPLFADIK